MKKFWKVLGLATLAAAVPIRIKKDDENRKKTYQSLLISVDVDTDESGRTSSVGINIGDGVISSAITNLVTARKEAELFADDEPEAAVLDADEMQALTDEAQAAEEAARDADGEEDEAQNAAEKVQDAADNAAQADFDPEF